ncbi:MAG: DUF5994 family protein [Nocardioides sp.]
MATHAPAPRTTSRFALRPVFNQQLPDGAWWPESRRLSDQLEELFALWPAGRGSIIRVLYSPPDWEDRPRSVAVSRRRIKTGSFPRDDTHQLTLSMFDGARRSITVIPPDTPADEATAALDGVLEDDDGGHV